MMTKEDIKKGLENCGTNPNSCDGCPYDTLFRCFDKLKLDARACIIEQEQEIERLKAENEELSKVVSSKVYDLIDNTKEIADAREAWEQQAKIDVLNELKSKSYVNNYCREVIEVEKIDEVIKEIGK